MNTIKQHIRDGSFLPVYLICGTETFLKKMLLRKLKNSISGAGDDFNYSHFEGKPVWQNELIGIADTMPFMAERRLIVVEDSGLFKVQNELADYVKSMSDTTVLVFSEQEADKRNRLYKAVKDRGYICEIAALKPQELKLFVASALKKDGKRIRESHIQELLDLAGTDMVQLANELEKLINYVGERDIIEEEDIRAVITEQLTSKIFTMMDCISEGRVQQAYGLYHDLLLMKEKPMSILFRILSHYNRLWQVSRLRGDGKPDSVIAERVGCPPWAVKKYLAQARNFGSVKLREQLEYGIQLEQDIKTGNINEQIAVEIMLAKFGAV